MHRYSGVCARGDDKTRLCFGFGQGRLTVSSAEQQTRLDVRLAEDHKAQIEQAANLLGQSVSAFTVSTLVREAEEVIGRFGALRLGDRDRDAFLAALDNPPPPNERLGRARDRYADEVAE